jgi:hypothetical protein
MKTFDVAFLFAVVLTLFALALLILLLFAFMDNSLRLNFVIGKVTNASAVVATAVYAFWTTASMNESLDSIKSLSLLIPSAESSGWIFESGWLNKPGRFFKDDAAKAKEQTRLLNLLQERSLWEEFIATATVTFSSRIMGFALKKEHIWRFIISMVYFVFLLALRGNSSSA